MSHDLAAKMTWHGLSKWHTYTKKNCFNSHFQAFPGLAGSLQRSPTESLALISGNKEWQVLLLTPTNSAKALKAFLFNNITWNTVQYCFWHVSLTGCYNSDSNKIHCNDGMWRSWYVYNNWADLRWHFLIFFQRLKKILSQWSDMLVRRNLLKVVQDGQNHSTNGHLTSSVMYQYTLSNHHHHHIRFSYLRCCGCPGLQGRQHLATPHTRSPWIPV